MKLDEFVRDYLHAHTKDPLPDPWVKEVQRIAAGGTSDDSAKGRDVTRNAVKAQRKKIFKRLEVPNSKVLLTEMLKDAVRRVTR